MATYRRVSKDDDQGLILECACGLNEHQLHFLYWADEKMPEIYVSPHLCPFPFWRRLWLGIKYIFGYRSRYGDYPGLVLYQKDIQELQRFLRAFLDIEEHDTSEKLVTVFEPETGAVLRTYKLERKHTDE